DVGFEGDLQFRPHAVRPAHQDRLFETTRQTAQAREAPDPVEDKGGAGAVRQGFDAPHELVSAVYVYAGLTIGNRHGGAHTRKGVKRQPRTTCPKPCFAVSVPATNPSRGVVWIRTACGSKVRWSR